MSDALVAQVRGDYNRLRGRLFQLVEALGVPEGQELAMKGCIRSVSYDAQANLEAMVRREDEERKRTVADSALSKVARDAGSL